MDITQTSSKPETGHRNRGARVTIKALGKIIDQFEVPKRNGIAYCKEHPNGVYGKRFAEAVRIAKEKDSWLEEMEKKNVV